MRGLLIAASVGLAITTIPAIGQDSDQADLTFRGGVDFVRVDMYASSDGTPITDLRADEIEVREDGVLQTIETFEHVSVPSGGPEATRIQPSSVRESEQMLEDPRARVFVAFVDTYHFEAQFSQQMQTPLRRFLEEALGPDDLVAIMTPEMDVSDLTFGRKTTVLSEFFSERIEWMKRDVDWFVADDTEYQYQQCYPGPNSTAREMIRRRREKLTFDALENLSRYLGLARDERKTVLVATMGWTIFEPDRGLANATPRDNIIPIAPIDRITGGRGPSGTGQTTHSMQVQCEADRQALAMIDHRNRLREIIGAANRGNVSFYPITPLRNPGFSGGAGSLERLSELRGMAEDTDGMAIVNTNNIGPAMQRVIEDSSSYYLIGYQSTKSPDGSYRSIRVTVKRPGVEVRARRGYRSASEGEARAAAAAAATAVRRPDEAITRAFDEVARAQTSVPLRVRGSAWSRGAAGGTEGRLWLVGELDAATRRAPEWRSGASAEFAVRGPDGGQFQRTVDLAPNAYAFAVDLADTARSLPPGAYEVRVSVRPRGDGVPVTETTRVDVPEDPSPFGHAVLLRRIGTQPHVMTADPRFRRNERLRLELPTASAAPVDARVIDRNGQETQVPAAVTERDDPSGDFRWIVVDVVLAPFASSDYAVAVTQDGATSITAFRVVQ